MSRRSSKPKPVKKMGESVFISRSEHAYRELRNAIQQGKLLPGTRLKELEIAKWLQISRTPVRDALHRLVDEGVFSYEFRTGLVVTQLERLAVMELYVAREGMEGMVSRLCAHHASDAEIENLEELLKKEKKIQGNDERLVQHNRQFHHAIRKGARNRYLEKSLAMVDDSNWLLGEHLRSVLPHRAEDILAQHTEIVQAIRSRDPDASEQAARRHVRSSQRERLKLLFQNESVEEVDVLRKKNKPLAGKRNTLPKGKRRLR